MLKEKMYERRNWRGVIHTTWNPNGPGVIRIHMIPPKFSWFRFAPAVVLLNGQELLPMNESWAILLTEFVNHVNAHGPGELSTQDLEVLLDKVCEETRKVYPAVSNKTLMEDLSEIVDIFESIVNGKTPAVWVGGLSVGEYAHYMRAPHRMDLMISAMTKNGSWNCNQKCLHCYAAGQHFAQTAELTTQEWKKIIHACRKAGIPQVTFTGGEPTLRTDLCELIREARWFVTRLNTNGVLLTKELCEQFREAELDSVQITLYSHDARVHNLLVGADNFYKTVAGIRHALAAGLNVSINTPLCKLNKEYAETLKFVKMLGVSYVTCSGLIVSGNAKKAASVDTQLSKEEIFETVKNAAGYCFANGMEISFTSPGWISEEKLRSLGLDVPSCGACLSNMAVTPDGQAIPCQSWLSEKPLGDMQKVSFRKIWMHPRCRKHRRFSAKMTQRCPFRKTEDMV